MVFHRPSVVLIYSITSLNKQTSVSSSGVYAFIVYKPPLAAGCYMYIMSASKNLSESDDAKTIQPFAS